MLNITVSLVILTLAFSLVAAGAFSVRRRLFAGREGMMYPFWVILLAITLLPIRAELPDANTVSAESLWKSNVIMVEPDWLTVTESGVITADGKFVPGESVSEVSSFMIGQRVRRFLAASAKTVSDAATAVFILWMAGAVISFSRVAVSYKNTRRLCFANSRGCTDSRLLACCEDICRQMKIRRRITVREFDIDAMVSPCVMGVFRPVLFVDAGTASMDGDGLRYVLAHELTHIKRNDMVIKLFCLFAASVHWMSPMSSRVVDAVMEDCELSCDYGVLRMYGSSVSGVYMGAILDIARRCSEGYKRMTGERYAGGLFAIRTGSVSFLRRRYENMKNYKKDRASLCIAAIFCGLSLLFTTMAISACADVNEAALDSAIKLDLPFDAMMRAYYGLGPDDSITPEMLDGIDSLTVTAVIYGERITAEFTVNGEFTARALLPVAPSDYYESVMLAAIETYSADDQSNANRFKAFYTLDNEHVIEQLVSSQYGGVMSEYMSSHHLISAAERYESFYMLDPYTTDRELNALRAILESAGLYEAWTLDSYSMDCSSLGYFDNLDSVEFVGVTPVGFTFPEAVTVSVIPAA